MISAATTQLYYYIAQKQLQAILNEWQQLCFKKSLKFTKTGDGLDLSYV